VADGPQQEVRVVEPAPPAAAAQRVPVVFGISEATVGARQLAVNLTSFEPGGSTAAHLHEGFETGIYAARGDVELFYGERLERSVVVTEGSFCFIPAGVPHKAYNLSDTEPALFVTARSDPNEQERVRLTPDADDGSPDQRVKETKARLAR
jgi:uncharacterized RmlC-like cupin family protein